MPGQPSPAELLYGRKVRANLPAKNDVTPTVENHREWLESNAKRSAEYYNRTAGSAVTNPVTGYESHDARSGEIGRESRVQ